MAKFTLSKSKQTAWDFFPVNNLVLDDRFSALAKDKLIPFAQTKTGTIICYWKKSEKEILEKAPIVWIDSESMPIDVICDNINEFKQLIPYGSSFVKQLWILIKNYESNKKIFISPDRFFIEWLKEKDGKAKKIEIDLPKSNPVTIMSDSMKKYSTSFQKWLINNTQLK